MSKSEQTIEMVPIGKLKPDPNQPRTEWDSEGTMEHIEELAASYAKHGIIQPLEVDEDNVIILGECRYRAAKKIGLKRIPIRKVKGVLQEDRLERQLIDDAQRKTLNDMERTWAYAAAVASINDSDKTYTVPGIKRIWKRSPEKLIILLTKRDGRGKKGGASELARRTGVGQSFIDKHLSYFRIEKIPDEAREAADEGLLSYSDLAKIGQVKTPEVKKAIVRSVVREKKERKKEGREQIAVGLQDRVDVIRKIEKRGGSQELLVATAEADIEPDDAEALAEVPVEVQPEAVKIVKKQPTPFARKVVARQLAVEVPPRAAEVKVSKERIEELKAQAEAHDRHMAEVDADPRVKEIQRLYRSSTVLFGLQGEIENAFCPVCGEDAIEHLRFLCHPKLTIDEAYDMTMKKHKQLRVEKGGDN